MIVVNRGDPNERFDDIHALYEVRRKVGDEMGDLQEKPSYYDGSGRFLPPARNLGKGIVIKPNETQPPEITDITKKPSYYDGSGSLEAIVKK